MILLDTDVLVDCLRGTASARAWLTASSGQQFAVPGVVAMELLMGCRNPAEVDSVKKFLNIFSIVWTTGGEFARAFDLLAALRPTSGIGIPDCLIAATALSRDATLYTFNTKHFRAVHGLNVQQPFARP
jgi:predicted nucleic acid-binding protein